jgi:hypothetical protein
MSLDSDVMNADSHLMVEFYENTTDPDYKNAVFIRIMSPGDKTNIIEQPVQEHHKRRFPRQWLHYQMQNNDASVIGTPLEKWSSDRPEEFNSMQLAEMQILKFQTVEQIATASDSQMQRVGMGAVGMRERARAYLSVKNQSESSSELARTRNELDELKAQMAMLMSQMVQEPRKPGRPRKEDVNVEYDAPVGDSGH